VKLCSECQESRPLSGFHKMSSAPDGLQYICKACRADLRSIQFYGISLEDKQSLVVNQGGLCAICETPLTRAHTDHDHQTNLVRGILCPDCNKGLGLFKDSQRSLSRAIGYLGKSEDPAPHCVASSG
jgi:protein-arginine kinase activator protein McsA